MRIHADVGKCQGYGNCVGLDQAHFDLDDDGLKLMSRRQFDETFPQALIIGSSFTGCMPSDCPAITRYGTPAYSSVVE